MLTKLHRAGFVSANRFSDRRHEPLLLLTALLRSALPASEYSRFASAELRAPLGPGSRRLRALANPERSAMTQTSASLDARRMELTVDRAMAASVVEHGSGTGPVGVRNIHRLLSRQLIAVAWQSCAESGHTSGVDGCNWDLPFWQHVRDGARPSATHRVFALPNDAGLHAVELRASSWAGRVLGRRTSGLRPPGVGPARGVWRANR